mmetsp:Transcript_68668/g.217182  ORF Transcript_68668/g.217182 Transcript_68668/m.217182 type:complete len:345 (-) Transcript_68668:1991-3025(-)
MTAAVFASPVTRAVHNAPHKSVASGTGRRSVAFGGPSAGAGELRGQALSWPCSTSGRGAHAVRRRDMTCSARGASGAGFSAPEGPDEEEDRIRARGKEFEEHEDDDAIRASSGGWTGLPGFRGITGRGARTGVELEFLATGEEEVVIDDKVFEDGTFETLAELENWWDSLETVYVLLFGVGTETEGIYSLRSANDEGLPVDIILAFEDPDDAKRYSVLLEAQMEHCPEVEGMPPDDLIEFCMDSGYNCRVMPAGSLIMPSENTVEVTDWERAMRLREGMWSVTASDYEPSPMAATLEALLQEKGEGMEEVEEGGMDGEELSAMRERFEALFATSTSMGADDEDR